jgi:PilZ domain
MGALPNTINASARQSAPCEAPVMVDAGHFWCTAHAIDVSTEELTMTDVQSALLQGTGVDIYFELGGLVAIEARAVVTRVEGHRVTLRFLDLDAEAARALDAYVSGGFHSSTHIRQRTLGA